MTQIQPDVLRVLESCEFAGNTLFLTTQLDRPMYMAVNKVLEALGGKWNRRAKGHVFDTDPIDVVDAAIATGAYVDPKKAFQFFETPPSLVERMLDLADLRSDSNILEPSAGRGAIANRIMYRGTRRNLTLVELDPKNVQYLRNIGYIVIEMDFLQYREPSNGTVTALALGSNNRQVEWHRTDRIVMNPPFSRGQDMAHVTHAFNLLPPNGVLVAITSESPFFRETKQARAFRELVAEHGWAEKLDPGTFAESGTMVNTRIMRLHK